MSGLLESILQLEGKPKKTKMQPEFEVWLKNIDHTQRTRVIRRMMAIHKFGLYGKKSHELFDSCEGLFEIVFDDSLKIYFTIEEPFVSLEDGSHSKSGGPKTGSQKRVIDKISKRLKEAHVNKQWYEKFVSPTELLLSFKNNDDAFDDLSSDQNADLIYNIAKIISIRTNENIEEILNDLKF
jgi:hypothetical protein